jgi:hypothetical protein
VKLALLVIIIGVARQSPPERGKGSEDVETGEHVTIGDLVENRPALSRWHPAWRDRFAFMSARKACARFEEGHPTTSVIDIE